MDCLNCGEPLLMMPQDQCAAYRDYVERYVDCAHCNHTNVVRYSEPETICTYQKVRNDNGGKS